MTGTLNQRIVLDGLSFRLRIEGAGAGAPWLTFSNSHATDLHLWDGQVAALADRFRILRYDARGHGGSDASDGAYDMALLADDAVALWDELGIERSHLVGLSLGGTTGLELAARFPRRVASLVACDCRHMVTEDFIKGWAPRIALARHQGMDALVDSTIERWFTPAYRAANPPELDRVRDMIRRTSVAGYIGCAEALKGIDTEKRLGGIRCPVLAMGGEFDPSAPPALMADIAARIPGARHVVIDGAAHMSNLEQPEAFNRALDDFLKNVTAKETAR
jgi:3-oxoadipate enol-lactonase